MSRLSTLPLILLLGACAPTDPGQSPPAAETATPDPVDALHILNARRPSPELLTGGQIEQEQMTALRDLGYSTFINLRTPEEEGTGWEEGFAAEAGVTYHRLPVAGASGISVENAEQLAGLMQEAAGKPVVIYCASGNRVGALLALKAHFVDGASPQEALALGLDAGLTRLEPKVRELLGLPSE